MRRSLFQKIIDVEERRDDKNKIMATESSWSTKMRSVPCEIEIVSAKEQNFQERESVEKQFRVYYDEQGIHERDRIVGRSKPLSSGTKYEIIGIEPWDNYYMMRLRLWQ